MSCVCGDAAEGRAAQDELGLSELGHVDLLTQGSLRKVYRLFRDADGDGNGKVDHEELANMFGLPEDVYLERLIDILDVDGNRTIDFREFVVGLAAFVLSGHFGRVRFAFRLFDLNNDGSFSRDELLTAIRASEERHQETKEFKRTQSNTYWGDTRREDPHKPYADVLKDLDARLPHEMDYDEFVKVVTRFPRVFAPVNLIWNVLRPYADPAVSVVRELRKAGNRKFFKGTVLESGRAEVIFAPVSSAGNAPGEGGAGGKYSNHRLWEWLNDTRSPDRHRDVRVRKGGRADAKVQRAGAGVPARGSGALEQHRPQTLSLRGPGGGRPAFVPSLKAGLRSIGKALSPSKKKLARSYVDDDDGDSYAWDGTPPSSARTMSEVLAEELLEQDAAALGISPKQPQARPGEVMGGGGGGFSPTFFNDGAAGGTGAYSHDVNEGAGDGEDVDMREIWAALQNAPSNHETLDRRPSTLKPRHRAQDTPLPKDYNKHLDAAAHQKRALVLERKRTEQWTRPDAAGSTPRHNHDNRHQPSHVHEHRADTSHHRRAGLRRRGSAPGEVPAAFTPLEAEAARFGQPSSALANQDEADRVREVLHRVEDGIRADKARLASTPARSQRIADVARTKMSVNSGAARWRGRSTNRRHSME